ncbi:hypothetical protein ACIPTS_34100 [Streptomyces sp. LARHCF252]
MIDEMLRADLDAPRKQRHTVKRIFDRLLDEHGAEAVTYPMVRAYVADRRPQIAVEAGRGVVHAFIPQSHRPGAEAEVDFGDMKVRLAGEQVTCFVFAMRLSYSGKAVHRVFASCGQEAFLEGHVVCSAAATRRPRAVRRGRPPRSGRRGNGDSGDDGADDRTGEQLADSLLQGVGNERMQHRLLLPAADRRHRGERTPATPRRPTSENGTRHLPQPHHRPAWHDL